MKTALFTFIVDRSSNGRTPAAGRRSQFAVWTKTLLYRIITA